MPPRAEVLVVSRSDYLQKKYANDWLPRAKHHVAASITEAAEAPEAISHLSDGRVRLDVAIFTDCKAGEEVFPTLNRFYPKIKTIAIVTEGEKPLWASRVIRSEKLDPAVLNDLITEL